ncbi:MAG: helix-turn-helix domain-containing protein [Anaerolineae bacterium]|nr:MAG: helix-turn-helix domain-containing protein [Anaerolineae bacterium]
MSQQALAYKLGVHRNTISAWERGEYLPDTRDGTGPGRGAEAIAGRHQPAAGGGAVSARADCDRRRKGRSAL